MKFVLVSVIVAIVVSCVYGESCTANTDCAATRCGSGFHVICEHKDGAGITNNGGLCTCAKDEITCTTQADCIASTYQCVSDNNKHCYDGKCICTRW